MKRIGLPLARARALRLAQAWRCVAGELVARRAPATGVRRGVLEIVAADAHWVRALEPLLPEHVARLTVAFPDLGVLRFRLRQEGVSHTPPAIDVDLSCFPVEAPMEVRGEVPTAPVEEQVDIEQRLREVRRRYLERSGAAEAGQKP